MRKKQQNIPKLLSKPRYGKILETHQNNMTINSNIIHKKYGNS